MRKITAFLCAVVLLSGLLTSCGSSSSKTNSRVELSRGGKILEYTVEDFSESYYDIDELEDFIDEAIDIYKEENKGRIKVKRERLRKDKAYLTIRYNKPETYAAFNNVECFSGTVAEALEAGYDFSMPFIMAMDEYSDFEEVEEIEAVTGEETGDVEIYEATETVNGIAQVTVAGQSVIADDSLKVLIIGTDSYVTVPGDVQYYYTSYGAARLKSRDTVAISVDEDLAGDSNVVYVLYN